MGPFRQIIFPPLPKVEVVSAPTVERKYRSDGNAAKLFDSWIVGTPGNFILYVKCPTCDFTYELETALEYADIQRSLDEYSIFYFKKIVTECPHRKEHRGYYV